jgi:hypothetical protein
VISIIDSWLGLDTASVLTSVFIESSLLILEYWSIGYNPWK